MTHEEVTAWRAQIDMAEDIKTLEDIVLALKRVHPEVFILVEVAEKRASDMAVGRYQEQKRAALRKLRDR